MAHDLSLNQIVDTSTRGTAILDLIFTNRPDLIKNPKPLAGLGDHEIVSHKISLQPIRKKPAKREILLSSKIDVSKLRKDTQTFRTKFLRTF